MIVCSLMKRHQGGRAISSSDWVILWLFARFPARFGRDPVWKRSPPFWEHVGKASTRKSPFPPLASRAAPARAATLPGGLVLPIATVSHAQAIRGSVLLQGPEGITAPRHHVLPPSCPSARSPCLPGSMWLPASSPAFYPHPSICRHLVGHFAPQDPQCNVFPIAGFTQMKVCVLQPKMEENAVASPAAQGAPPGVSREACLEPRAQPEPVCQLLVPGMGEPRGLAQAGSKASWGQGGQQQPPLPT